jgi:4-hydroxybenzoate polyprenyltransferase
MSAKASGTQRTRPRRGIDLARTLPVSLVRASHPRQALLVSAVLAGAAALSGRGSDEVGLVLVTALVGQVILGWHNDLVDAARDRSHDREGKPIAQGYVEAGTVWFALAVAVLLVIPLSMANGIEAGLSHLIALAVAMAANAGLLRRTRWSYLPWMISFGLLPAFLAYGGWGGEGSDTPPTILMTLLAALLGIGAHLLASLPGLVDDNKDGFRTFPLTIALKTGAPRLLLVSTIYTTVMGVTILIAGLTVGLAQ